MGKKAIRGFIAKIPFKEEFKAEVEAQEVKFPKELGIEHPFDFEDAEKITKRFGLVNGAIDKYVDAIVGEFTIKAKEPKIETAILKFVKNTNFSLELRRWIRDGLSKGNGFMEIDLVDQKIRAINANNMFVRMNRKGKILGYNQFLGSKKFQINATNVIPFEPNEIAHIKINHFPGDAYGGGFVYCNETQLNSLASKIRDLDKLIERKAGAPLHVRIGEKGMIADQSAITEFANKLQYMNNRTEWVTDGNIEMNVLDFGDIGKNLIDAINNTIELILFGFQIPEVLMGRGNIPEGLAKVQMEAWQRKVAAIQEGIEAEVREKIFKPILNAQKLDGEVEFTWNLPGEEEINKRITQIKELLNVMTIDENMRRGLQIELAKLLNMPDLMGILPQIEKGADEEAKAEKQLKQPEIPGEKPNAHECLHESFDDMGLHEFINIREQPDFNFSEYLSKVLEAVRNDPFSFLHGKTEQEIIDGLLSDTQVEKLRLILKDGFKNNQTMKEIEKNIDTKIGLKNLIKDGKIISLASNRAPNIARTETIRLSNIGLVSHYKENKVEQVRFLAALSERTCPICEELNGRVYSINELEIGVSQPPIHNMCRCSLVPVVEL